MDSFDEIIGELQMLSLVLQKEELRICFIEHFMAKIKRLAERCTSDCMDKSILRKLQMQLCQPVMLHLRTVRKSTEKCILIQCLIQVLKLTPITDINLFFNLYILLFSQIFNNDPLNCEELKMIVFTAGSCLIMNSDSGVLKKVFTQESGEKYSMGIFMAVRTAKDEKYIKLRLEALNFLLVASQYNLNIEYNKGIYIPLGNLFMLYLPGIIAPLQEIILRDETQHHLVTVTALTCWGHILCLVLNDSSCGKHTTENDTLKEWINIISKAESKSIIDTRKALNEKKRTKNWLQAASVTLKPLILKITQVRKHSNGKCRLELVKVLASLMDNCSINLEASLNPVVEVLVGSLVDDNEQVSLAAKEALKKFEATNQIDKQNAFISIIETNFYELLNKLPGIIHSGNEKQILSSLKSLSGYLRILGEANKLKHMTSVLFALKKLLFVLQVGFALELQPELSNQTFFISDESPSSKQWTKPWKVFCHFSDEFIKFELERACHLLGEFGDAETLLDYVMNIYTNNNNQMDKETLIILNQIILGMRDMDAHLTNQLLDFYLNSANIYLTLRVGGENCTKASVLYSNIVKVALVMEGIQHLAVKLGMKFQNFLLKTLYYVVESMGSNYTLISTEANKAAVAIATGCGFEGNIGSLIKANIDYLTFHSVMKLRRNDSTALDVVMVSMENSAVDAMPSLEGIIKDALKSSSQNTNSPQTMAYLRLFQTFVFCVRKWLQYPKGEVKTDNPEPEEQRMGKIINYIKMKRKEEEEAKSENQMWNSEGEMNEEDPEEAEMPPETPIPQHISLTCLVCNHCINFLAAKDDNKKLIVLQVLNESVMILAEWENELLPIVHKIWSPLVARFDQMSSPLILRASFSLVCTLARTSRQFIRSRTLRNVLPALRHFLLKEAGQCKFQDSSSEYCFTQNFKLQCQLLGNLGALAVDLQLFERETDLILESALPYLSVRQPKQLQENCRNLFSYLKNYDPCLVWFKLHHLSSNSEFANNVAAIFS